MAGSTGPRSTVRALPRRVLCSCYEASCTQLQLILTTKLGCAHELYRGGKHASPKTGHCGTHAQVILKPDPGRPQELYLGSLAALGIDASAHDIRFVEDNWENPTLGAWGLGWEVWLDGALPLHMLPMQQLLRPASVHAAARRDSAAAALVVLHAAHSSTPAAPGQASGVVIRRLTTLKA